MNKKQQTGYNFSSVDLLIYIWQKRWILITVGLITGITSIIVSLLITPKFESSVIMFPASSASVAKELLVQNYSGRQNVHGFGEEEQAEQLLQILNSEPVRSRIIGKYNLMEHYEIDPDQKYPLTELYSTYKSNINFTLTEYMSVEISVMDTDPQLAADIANDIADLVDTVYNSMKKERAREALRLVEREYREAEAELVVLRDSFDMLGQRFSGEVNTPGDPTNNLIRAVAENGASYMSMLSVVQNEAANVAELSLRYREARLEAEQDLPYKFIVERAFASEKKAYPNKSLIVIVSTFSSLLFALIVLIVIDNIRDRLALREEQ